MPAKKPVPTKAAAKPEKLPARQAAKVILLNAGKPMHYRDISKAAIEQGIVKVRGSSRKKPDPAKTMKTIRSYLCEAEGTEFVRVDEGVFDLKERVEKAAAKATAKAAKAKAAKP